MSPKVMIKPNRIMKYTFTALLCLIIIPIVFAQQSPMSLNWQFGQLGNNPGSAGILTIDLDGDGKSEIIASGSYGDPVNGNNFISVSKYEETTKQFKAIWISRVYFSGIRSLKAYDLNKDGLKEIFVVFADGRVVVLESETFNEVANFAIAKKKSDYFDGSPVSDITFGDINNDFSVDVIVLTTDSTFIFDSSYKLTGNIPLGAAQCMVGNIDEDPSLEVVYANGQIVELKDGKVIQEYKLKKNTQSQSVDIGLVDLNGDQILDVIYSSADSLYAYDFRHMRPIWTTKWESDHGFNQYISGLWLIDYDSDGTKDVLIGNYEWDGLYGYNGKNGKKEFNIYDFNDSGIKNVTMAELDNDSNLELIWSNRNKLFIYDITTKAIEWKGNAYYPSFKAFDVGDFDNDQLLDIALTGFTKHISIFDADTKFLKKQGGPEPQMIQAENYTAVKVGDIDNDGKNELLLGIGNSHSSSRVYVLDTNYAVVRYYEVHGMDIIIDIEIADIDADGNNEVIVALGTYVSGSTKPEEWQNHLYIFDGQTGVVEWKSPILGGMSSIVGSLAIGNIDQDAALEVVALQYSSWRNETPSLLIIDGKTHVLTEKQIDIHAVDLADSDGDGIEEIIFGDGAGKVIILDGVTLEAVETYDIRSGQLQALKAIDLNNDGQLEFVAADAYKLYVYDTKLISLKWQSDTLSESVGTYNSLIVADLDADQHMDILLNGGHCLYNFEIQDYDALRIIKPIASITFSGLDQEYTGDPKQVTVVTYPAGLAVDINYNGETPLPVNVGQYSVSAVIVDEFYQGEANATLTIHASKLETARLYPNPTTGKTRLDLPAGANARILVTDTSGRIIKQAMVAGSEEFDLGSNAKGLYFLKIELLNKIPFTLKLIKQ